MQVRQTVPYFAFIYFSRYISWLPGLTHCLQDRKYLCQAKACLTEVKSKRKKKKKQFGAKVSQQMRLFMSLCK